MLILLVCLRGSWRRIRVTFAESGHFSADFTWAVKAPARPSWSWAARVVDLPSIESKKEANTNEKPLQQKHIMKTKTPIYGQRCGCHLSYCELVRSPCFGTRRFTSPRHAHCVHFMIWVSIGVTASIVVQIHEVPSAGPFVAPTHVSF